MYLEVEAHGDFDMRYTAAIFELPDGTDIKQLLKAFAEEAGLKPMRYPPDFAKEHGLSQPQLKIKKDGIDGMSDEEAPAANSLFLEWLKKRGYRGLKTKKVCI